MNKAGVSFKHFLNSILDFLFYLPVGGETTFRRTCIEFTCLDKGDEVLELCCSTGDFTAALTGQNTGARITGADISLASVKTAYERLQHTTTGIILASAVNLPFFPNSFDKCVVSFGMHHMREADRKKALAEVYRVLKNNGSLYIFDYAMPEKRIVRPVAFIYTSIDSSDEAYTIIKNGSLLQEIEQAGFKIENRALTGLGIVQLLEIRKNRAIT
jgi:ubiquinone/menaquinone biosynthesis C-methylase UbiE